MRNPAAALLCAPLFQAAGRFCGPELPDHFQHGTQRRHHPLRVRPGTSTLPGSLLLRHRSLRRGESLQTPQCPPPRVCRHCSDMGTKTFKLLFSPTPQASTFWELALGLRCVALSGSTRYSKGCPALLSEAAEAVVIAVFIAVFIALESR